MRDRSAWERSGRTQSSKEARRLQAGSRPASSRARGEDKMRRSAHEEDWISIDMARLLSALTGIHPTCSVEGPKRGAFRRFLRSAVSSQQVGFLRKDRHGETKTSQQTCQGVALFGRQRIQPAVFQSHVLLKSRSRDGSSLIGEHANQAPAVGGGRNPLLQSQNRQRPRDEIIRDE